MKKQRNLRSMAAQAVEQVVEQGQSLSNILPPLQQKVSDKDKALLQELCFGVLRTLSQLDWLINKLMARPMTGKQRTVHYLIMVGLYQPQQPALLVPPQGYALFYRRGRHKDPKCVHRFVAQARSCNLVLMHPER